MELKLTEKATLSLNAFDEDLDVLSPVQIVRKHILHGECCILSPHEYFTLRSEIAKFFGLHPNQVLVVGSAKLGFSIVPCKPYRPFCDESDIDVALVSSTLFDKTWEDVFRYRDEVGYWPQFKEFSSYLFRGWIRPDKVPRSKIFSFGKEWWEFFRRMARDGMYGDYNIRGALYKSHFYLENYQKICVQQCIAQK